MERSNEPCTNSTLRAQSIFIALCVSLPRVWLWPGCKGLQAARSRQDLNGQESVPRALSWLKARPRWAAPLQRLAGRRVLLSRLLSPRVPAHQDSGALIVTSRLQGGAAPSPHARSRGWIWKQKSREAVTLARSSCHPVAGRADGLCLHPQHSHLSFLPLKRQQ